LKSLFKAKRVFLVIIARNARISVAKELGVFARLVGVTKLHEVVVFRQRAACVLVKSNVLVLIFTAGEHE
jgi:hypothetical protein